MSTIPTDLALGLIMAAFILGAICLWTLVARGAATEEPQQDSEATPLGPQWRCTHPASKLEMTPAREARLRALNRPFAKAQDQIKASDAWAEKIRRDATGAAPQAAMPETPARGVVMALPNPQRKV